MLIRIDSRSTVAVYVQIENNIQFAIASGKIKPGERLPSVREMSENLGVNQNTIAKAYRDLEVMGLVNSRRGMGVFVNENVDELCRRACRGRVLRKLFEAAGEGQAAGMNAKDLKAALHQCIESGAEPHLEPPESLLCLVE